MRTSPILVTALFLAACSSGDDSPSPTPSPTPSASAPTFTSPATASVAENSTLAYQATATDANADQVAFTIVGGADASLFSINSTGAVSFISAPSFETPKDADGDNTYQVELRASDGILSSTLAVSIILTNSKEGIRVVRVGNGFTQPVFVASVPGDNNRVFVAERGGAVYCLTTSGGGKQLAFLATVVASDPKRGLLGIAASPDFATSKIVFIQATDIASINISRFDLSAGGPQAISQTMRYVIGAPDRADNHNGGWLGFGPDGLLYAAIGDGRSNGDPDNNAQNLNLRLGKILRLKIDNTPGAAKPFGPAPGNPFAAGGGDPYIFAYGVRNPWRGSFDGDRLLFGDVGEDSIEEIDVAPINSPGLNFGWRFLEGTKPFVGTAPVGLTAPVAQYDHGTGPKQGNSIIGGYVYRGPITSLQGSYVFGDYVTGNIWTLPAASLVQGQLFPAANFERRNLDFTPDVGTIDQIVSFGVDNANNLYIVDYDGDIFRAEPS